MACENAVHGRGRHPHAAQIGAPMGELAMGPVNPAPLLEQLHDLVAFPSQQPMHGPPSRPRRTDPPGPPRRPPTRRSTAPPHPPKPTTTMTRHTPPPARRCCLKKPADCREESDTPHNSACTDPAPNRCPHTAAASNNTRSDPAAPCMPALSRAPPTDTRKSSQTNQQPPSGVSALCLRGTATHLPRSDG